MTCIRRAGSVWTSCTCPPCTLASNRNSKLYRSGHLPVTDRRAQAVNRFNRWTGRGYSSRAIAHMTGISERTIQALMQARTDPARMQHGTAERILAAADTPTGGGWVPSIGCVRRLRALTVNGWSMRELSRRSGLGEATLAALRSDTHRTTRPRFAATVTALYDELWDTPGPGQLAGARARNRGWLPPLAWDDDTIDDPNSEPNLGEQAPPSSGRPSAHTVEDVEWLLEDDGTMAPHLIAERLRVTVDAIYRACRRAGRDDLRDRLIRNANYAGARMSAEKTAGRRVA